MILLIGEVLADNRSDQMNPNNDAIARGNNERSGDSDSSEYSDYKITGKINSTPVASKSPSDFDTEVKAISADNALLFVFLPAL